MTQKFTFFENFLDALEDCDNEEFGKAVRALCMKVFRGEDPMGLTGVAKAFYMLSLPNAENSMKSYEDGAKGGRPKNSSASPNERKAEKGGFENSKRGVSENQKGGFLDSQKGGNEKTETEKEKEKEKEVDIVGEGLDLHNPPSPPPKTDPQIEAETRGQPNAPPNNPLRPTLEAVREFCAQNGLDVDPEKFFAHYDSVGWVVSGRPIMDWRSRCLVWSKDNAERKAEKARASPEKKQDKFLNFEEREYDFDALEARFVKNLRRNE